MRHLRNPLLRGSALLALALLLSSALLSWGDGSPLSLWGAPLLVSLALLACGLGPRLARGILALGFLAACGLLAWNGAEALVESLPLLGGSVTGAAVILGTSEAERCCAR